MLNGKTALIPAESNIYWKDLFDSTSEGLKVLDEQGHLRMVNAAYAKRMGYTPEEVSAPGFNWLEAFFDPSGRERMRAKLKEAIQTGEIVRFENPHRHKDGHSVMMMTSLHLMPESGSAPSEQLKFVLGTMSDITHEAELTRKENYWREIYNSATEGLGIAGVNGRICDVNPAFAEMVGYDREVLLDPKMNWTHLTPPEFLAQDQHYITRALTGETVHYEKEFIHQSGRRIPTAISYRMLGRQPDWDCDRLIVAVSDITELKQQKQYWQSLFNSASEGLKVLDEQGRLHRVNAIYAERLGYTPEEVSAPGFNWLEAFFDPSGRERMRAKLKEAIQTGEIVRFENPHRHKDGHEVMAMTSLRRMPASDSAPAGQLKLVLSTMSDIAGLKQEKIVETARLLRQHTSNIQLGISELRGDNSNLVQQTNQQASSMEEIGASVANLEDLALTNAQQAAQTKTKSGEILLLSKKGSAVVTLSHEKMLAIGKANHSIFEIVSILDEIAFSTNILALNASVEAARAGEFGRGFAVVAHEVRQLSQNSRDHAKQIRHLIEQARELNQSGTILSGKLGEAFSIIQQSIEAISTQIESFSLASQNQSASTSEIAVAINSINSGLQNTSALVEESSTAHAAIDNEATVLMAHGALLDDLIQKSGGD